MLSLVSFQPTGLAQEKMIWSRAKIWLDPLHNLHQLSGLGLETEHGQHKNGRFFISDFSREEIERVRQAGFKVDILIPDAVEDFKQRNQYSTEAVQEDIFIADFCRKVKRWKLPKYWRLGSMGGHLRYEEMLQQLDSMKILFPELITIKRPIDTTKTIQGQPIYFVKISDNPDEDEQGEPRGLYTAIHHAREPVGMHQLLMFMWYLLENYDENADIKRLVNETALYFVPCLNPDGYLHNEIQEPNGGGMWRKNRRNNGDGTFGVDLNRNYGFNWGYDDFGSSPNSAWETYRGTGPFSEPETRALKAFCERNGFKTALNYHTYANLLIHPWGYENIACEDSILFRYLGRELVKENNYRMGTSMQVLNYTVNGGSDDFMYSVTPEKPKIIAMTPEVGNAFWPTIQEIPGFCLENLQPNLSIAQALLPQAVATDTTGLFLQSGTFPDVGINRIRYKIKRIGSNYEPCTFTLTIKPIGPFSSQFNTLSKTYENLPFNKELIDSLIVESTDPNNLAQPLPFQWEMTINNGIFETRDTITHFGSIPIIPATLAEPCENSGNWTGDWVFPTNDPMEGSAYLKPTIGDYSSDMQSNMTRIQPFDLRANEIKSAEMSLWTRYAIEKNYDYAAINFSVDSGTTWTTVCTDKSVLSSPFSQQAGQNIIPIWDGFQNRWQRETIDLKDYIGQKLWLRLVFHSDDFNEFDGFGIDNIQIKINTEANDIQKLTPLERIGLTLYPNPGNSQVIAQILGLGSEEPALLEIRDLMGRSVFSMAIMGSGPHIIQTELPPGMYSVAVTTKEGSKSLKKWVIQ